MSGMDKTQLLGMTPDELTVYFKQLGQPAFRARQVFAWLHQGADFEQMSNLPKALRETLDENCVANPVSVLETIESKLDGTIKLLYRLPDGNVIEGVLMRYKYGNTLCLSTQVGCRMGVRVLRFHAGRLRAQPDPGGDAGADCLRQQRTGAARPEGRQHRADGQRRTAG